ncbi:flavin reductase family protein [Zavarzinia compransoris]|uniref:Flavin reductase family protein n=2 Tax=Zavarzinia compransoris TaxID=1264899 RepID=A0A317EAJ0_9PROT|nr:flavin reductase family protein [Zavarzinia compransoris]
MVVPRPIAWVTSLDAAGGVNAAPFSFFNMLASEPPIVGLGIGRRPDGSPKDTARNIRERGEFTVNIVSNVLVEAMTVTATPFPPGISELAEAGLTAAPGLRIATPRIQEARAALECRLYQDLALPTGNSIFLGEVVAVHVDTCLLNGRGHVDPHGLDAVGRMGGDAYATTRYLFDLARIDLDNWQATHDPGTRRPHPAWAPRAEKNGKKG